MDTPRGPRQLQRTKKALILGRKVGRKVRKRKNLFRFFFLFPAPEFFPPPKYLLFLEKLIA